MKKVEYLDHTSEAEFRTYGKTLEEAFANAGLAMAGIMVDIEEVEAKKKKEIKVESGSLEKLLYDFLDELLYIRDVDGLFISRFEEFQIVEKEDGYALITVAFGDDILNYETSGDVKAPTYDEMKIEETEDGIMIQAVVDV